MVSQSSRYLRHRAALERLHELGCIFPCTRSRRDVQDAAGAPHEGAPNDEPVYPKEFRPPAGIAPPPLGETISVNWRFRVPDDHVLEFDDERLGRQTSISGRTFGDFVVWRKDDTPSYQLATVVDDAELQITEVVRGEDLVRSTFRQLLIFRALGYPEPKFYHAELLCDDQGRRLAKPHDALSIRELRMKGVRSDEILERMTVEMKSLGNSTGANPQDSR